MAPSDERPTGLIELFENSRHRLWLLGVIAGVWFFSLAVSCLDAILAGYFTPRVVAVSGLFLLFALALAGNVFGVRLPRVGIGPRAWLVVQIFAFLGLLSLTTPRATPVLLLLLVSQFPVYLRTGYAVGLALALNLLTIGGIHMRFGVAEAVGAVPLIGFQLFAFVSVSLAIAHRQAHLSLARANMELSATQALLADTARRNERLRISRDLHDRLGHNLAALNLRLELASHVPPSQAGREIEASHEISKLLSKDIREAVAQYRAAETVDIASLVADMQAKLPGVRILLEGMQTIDTNSSAFVEAMVRTIQEAVTNSIKHGEAQQVTILVEQMDSGILVRIGDNGKGCENFEHGVGLTGMKERLETVGGHLKILTPAEGFGLEFTLPVVTQ